MQNNEQKELLRSINDAIEIKNLYTAEKNIFELKNMGCDEDVVDIVEARCFVEKHNLIKALNILNTLLNKKKNNIDALLTRGKIYMNMGKRELGYSDFKNAHNLDKENIDIKYLLGRAAISCEKYEEARDIYKDLYHYSKDDQVFGLFETVNNYIVDGLDAKGKILSDEDKLSLSKSYYYLMNMEKALEIMKTIDNIGTLKDGEIIYSNILRTNRNYDMALYYIDNAIKKYCDDPRTYFYKGMLFENQKKYSGAVEYYNQAINIDKSYKPSYNRLAKLLIINGQYDKAIEISNKAIELNYDIDLAINYKGKALLCLGKNEEAIKYFNESIKKYPRCIDGYVNKSNAFRKQDLINEAFGVCDQAINLGYQDDRLAIEKTILFLKVEDYETALDWIEWAVNYNSDNILAHYLRAICYCKLNRYNDALEVVEQIISMVPNDISIYCGKLFIYISMGRDVDKLLDVIRNYVNKKDNSDDNNVKDFINELELSNSELKIDAIVKTVVIELEKILEIGGN